MIYQGGAWPEEYRGSIFMNNIHGARLNRDVLEPEGSGFVGRHAPDFLRRQRLVVADHQPQVRPRRQMLHDRLVRQEPVPPQRAPTGTTARTGGSSRSARVMERPRPYTGPVGRRAPNLREMQSEALVKMQWGNATEWDARHARRILQERGKDQVSQLDVVHLLDFVDPSIRLRGLWTLHATGWLDEPMAEEGLEDKDPYIRAWTIQFLCEESPPAQTWLTRFAALAKNDPSPVVRLYLAAALQRLPLDARRPIAQALLAHAEDADDPNLPYMLWFAVEPLAEADPVRGMALASGARVPMVQSFLTRRIASLGTPEAIGLLVKGLRATSDPALTRSILGGLSVAFRGRRSMAMPTGWTKVSAELARSADAEVRAGTRLVVDVRRPGSPQGGTATSLRSPDQRRGAPGDARNPA